MDKSLRALLLLKGKDIMGLLKYCTHNMPTSKSVLSLSKFVPKYKSDFSCCFLCVNINHFVSDRLTTCFA